MLGRVGAEGGIHQVDSSERIQKNPGLVKQGRPVDAFLLGGEWSLGQGTGYGMGKGLETDRPCRPGLTMKEPIIRPEPPEQLGSVEHPAIKGMTLPHRQAGVAKVVMRAAANAHSQGLARPVRLQEQGASMPTASAATCLHQAAVFPGSSVAHVATMRLPWSATA